METPKPGHTPDTLDVFNMLHSQYDSPLTRFVHSKFPGRPQEAQDAIQNTWEKVYKNLPRTLANGDFREQNWLFTIADHVTTDRHRWQQVRRVEQSIGDDPDVNLGLKAADDPQEEILRRETIDQVREVLQELPPKYRTVLEARMYHNLEYDKIGQERGISRSAVKSMLTRARAAFAKRYLKKYPEAYPNFSFDK